MATRGLKAKLYVDMAAGNDGTDFKELKSITGDWNHAFAFDEVAFITRGVGYEVNEKGSPKLSWSGKLLFDPADPVYLKVLDAAYSQDANILILALTGPKATPGSRGLQCLCKVFQANQDQGASSVLMDDVVIKPSMPVLDEPHTWLRKAVVGVGGAITYSMTVPADLDDDGDIDT